MSKAQVSEGSTEVRLFGLPSSTTTLCLYQLCAHLGAITTCNVNPETGGASVTFRYCPLLHPFCQGISFCVLDVVGSWVGSCYQVGTCLHKQ